MVWSAGICWLCHDYSPQAVYMEIKGKSVILCFECIGAVRNVGEKLLKEVAEDV